MKEIWKDIPRYEGLYQASNNGRIKSFHYNREKILKQKLGKGLRHGYYSVNLSNYNSIKAKSVHRLIMLAFKGYSALTVNHKNCIKTDNRLCNLEYMTIGDNKIHAAKNNTTGGTLKNIDVLSLRFLSVFHKFKRVTLCKIFNTSYRNVVLINERKRRRYVTWDK